MSVTTLVSMYVGVSAALGIWNWYKGHGFWLGFLFSLLLTPLIGWLTVALTPAVVIVDTARGRKRSCPHCFELTPIQSQFCDACGRDIHKQTVRDFLRLGELFVGLVATVIVVRYLMGNPTKTMKPTSSQPQEQVRNTSIG